MAKYIIKRLLLMIPIILGIAVLIFIIMYICPGDPARIVLGPNANAVQLNELRESLGLNRPFIVQLGDYLYNVFLKLDFGNSYISGRNITAEIMERFPYTLLVTVISVLIMCGVGAPLGIIAAIKQYKWQDNLAMFIALIGTAIPGFWLAAILSLAFCLRLKWFPATGADSWKCFVLPIIATSVQGVSIMARQARSSMLEVIRSDYIVTARAKGQKERVVIWRHAFQNALIPLITVAGTYFGLLLGGSMVIEIVFGIPGLGTYLMNSVTSRDYTAVEGTVIFISIIFCIVMLLVDLLYAAVDPRIKAQFAGKSKRRKTAKIGGKEMAS